MNVVGCSGWKYNDCFESGFGIKTSLLDNSGALVKKDYNTWMPFGIITGGWITAPAVATVHASTFTPHIVPVTGWWTSSTYLKNVEMGVPLWVYMAQE